VKKGKKTRGTCQFPRGQSHRLIHLNGSGGGKHFPQPPQQTERSGGNIIAVPTPKEIRRAVKGDTTKRGSEEKQKKRKTKKDECNLPRSEPQIIKKRRKLNPIPKKNTSYERRIGTVREPANTGTD